MKLNCSVLILMTVTAQVFGAAQVDPLSHNTRQKVEERRQAWAHPSDVASIPAQTPSNFYQDTYDAFISESPEPQSLQDCFNPDNISPDAQKQQILQKLFLRGLFATYDREFYMENCEGASYSDASIQSRKLFRESLVYQEGTHEYKDKTKIFKILLKIDEVQDHNHENRGLLQDSIDEALQQLSGNPEGTILKNWRDAITEECKDFILNELTNAVSSNLNKTAWERAQPFLFVIVVPICLYFVSTFALPDETITFVKMQQNHTKSFLELINFTNQFDNTLFSAAYCYQINTTDLCNITRFTIGTKAETPVYTFYIAPALALVFNIIKFGQQMLHEIFYFVYQYRDKIPFTKYERKNIEIVDGEVVDAVYEELVYVDETYLNKTLNRIGSFLPDLLKKRTWGFDQLLKYKIKQVNK